MLPSKYILFLYRGKSTNDPIVPQIITHTDMYKNTLIGFDFFSSILINTKNRRSYRSAAKN